MLELVDWTALLLLARLLHRCREELGYIEAAMM